MARVAYVNGSYRPYASAAVHVEDRGFQFADAVYEVIELCGGRLVDEDGHLDRLQRSLAEIRIDMPISRAALRNVMRQTIQRNRIRDGLVYLQVSRGRAPRDFLFPQPSVTPTLVCIARRTDQTKLAALAEVGTNVITMPEMRWARCDIKTVMLLPAVLAKETARGSGAREVWFLDRDGYVVEGASSNAWIINSDGQLLTRPLGQELLPGITRATVRKMAVELGLELIERPFNLQEALRAREAFNTAASATIMPVVRINSTDLGDGKPGPQTMRLRSAFHRHAHLSLD